MPSTGTLWSLMVLSYACSTDMCTTLRVSLLRRRVNKRTTRARDRVWRSRRACKRASGDAFTCSSPTTRESLATPQMRSQISTLIELPMDKCLDRDGYVVVRRFVEPQCLTQLAMECRSRILRIGGSDYWSDSVRDANAWLTSKIIRDFILSGSIGHLLGHITGLMSWQLYHSECIFKRPGDAEIGWHQDEFFSPVDSEVLALWVALSNVQSGRLRYDRSSHRLGCIQSKFSPAVDSAQMPAQSEIESRIIAENLSVDTPELNAGDAVIHAGWTVHGSEPNMSETSARPWQSSRFVPARRFVHI